MSAEAFRAALRALVFAHSRDTTTAELIRELEAEIEVLKTTTEP